MLVLAARVLASSFQLCAPVAISSDDCSLFEAVQHLFTPVRRGLATSRDASTKQSKPQRTATDQHNESKSSLELQRDGTMVCNATAVALI